MRVMAATQVRRRRKNESDGDSSAGGSANEGGVGRGAGGEGADSAGDGGGSKPTLLLYSSSKYKSLRTRVGIGGREGRLVLSMIRSRDPLAAPPLLRRRTSSR